MVVQYGSRFLSALAIKYKFVKHSGIYFHNLWPHGSSNQLTVKSKISGFLGNLYTGCPKIVSTKVLNDFFMLEIWPWVLAMFKMQNCHLFDLFSTEKPSKKQQNCSSPICSIKTMKKVHFLVIKGIKDGYFVFWSMAELMVLFSGS